MEQRPSTPPRSSMATQQAPPLTPEQVRRVEENRLRAKALRTQAEVASRRSAPPAQLAGQKRPHPSLKASDSTLRDARQSTSGEAASGTAGPRRPHDDIESAKKFTNYIEYDFAKMTDTKGGFLTAEDDPHNKALHKPNGDEKPAHMTLAEWERHQLLKKLREQRAGPFEPGISGIDRQKKEGCRECGGLEIDWQWVDVFGCRVCAVCRDKMAERYSLLTKTEAKEDYLLTDSELKDVDLLPRLEKPNPHKATYHSMQLFLRYQVEEYAFGHKKWGSGERLDEEFAKREKDKKKRKEDKFRSKLNELKKRTRVEAYKRARDKGAGGLGSTAQFGDRINSLGDKHEHEWGRTIRNADGTELKKCLECGMEVEELEF